MPDRVVVLDSLTADQIAAGEVVERPASVVKELVENAIDAGARDIRIDVRDGGISYIAVRDNGCGMSPQDALTALKRHATSKIRRAEDLHRIRTLGFRGEALPSIAAVSRLEILTREQDAIAGTRLQVEGGQLISAEDVGCPPGTQVIVRDLFFNTPVRRKHQRGALAEATRILEAVHHLALAQLQAAFRLSIDDSMRYQTTGSGKLADVVARHHGLEYLRQLLPIQGRCEVDGEAVVLDGLTGNSQLARANRQHQVFLVNGRSVQGNLLREALESCYESLLPAHRHPVAILQLKLHPAQLDVNIHPNKQQVRFQDENAIRRLVRQAVGQALSSAVLIPDVRFPRPIEKQERLTSPWRQMPVGPSLSREAPLPYRSPARSTDAGSKPPVSADLPGISAPLPEAERPPWDQLRPLGQIMRSYIVCEGPDGLYILDQHAAHERVYYERYRGMRDSNSNWRQVLAVPLQLELTPAEWQYWKLNEKIIQELGFRADEFGEHMLLLREVPVLFASFVQKGHAPLFRDVLDQWMASAGETGKRLLEIERARIILASCKAAVKANDPLSLVEMQALLQQLAGLEAPYTCPHGRPTVFRMNEHELARYFKRV